MTDGLEATILCRSSARLDHWLADVKANAIIAKSACIPRRRSYNVAMRWTYFSFALAIFHPSVAQACEPIIWTSDKDRLAEAILSVNTADVAVDGTVVKGSRDTGSIATIRPHRIWFGTKQPEYYIRKRTMCDPQFNAGENVRVLLYRIPENDSFFSRVWAWLWASPIEYASQGSIDGSEFGWAMQFKAMREAVSRKNLSQRRQLTKDHRR
jgi:hypothetical protein